MINLSADTAANSNLYDITGPFSVLVAGTFGSGTFNVQYQNISGDWVTFSDASFTAAGDLNINNRGSVRVRAQLTGSSSPDVDYELGGNGVNKVR